MLRKTLGVAAAAIVLAAAGCAEQDVGDSGDQAAVAYPSKTLQIMAPAAAGGGWDTTARSMQKALQDANLLNGQSAEVRNVNGAAGTIGLAELVSSHSGNAHQLMVTGLVMVGGVVTNKSPVDLTKTTPIATLTAEAEVVVVRADSPYTVAQGAGRRGEGQPDLGQVGWRLGRRHRPDPGRPDGQGGGRGRQDGRRAVRRLLRWRRGQGGAALRRHRGGRVERQRVRRPGQGQPGAGAGGLRRAAARTRAPARRCRRSRTRGTTSS